VLLVAALGSLGGALQVAHAFTAPLLSARSAPPGLRRASSGAWFVTPRAQEPQPPSKEELEMIASLEKDGAFEVGGRGSMYSEVGLPKALRGMDEAAKVAERKRIEEEEMEEERKRIKKEMQDRSASQQASGRSGGGGERPRRLPLPLYDVDSVGLRGSWEELGGNFLLRPPKDVTPKAVIHFLGGAFVGAAPHLTYNYLLNGLAEVGFIVVATPYPLGFDYLKVCDGILDRFEKAALPLAEEYGALPVVGIGHSCGALLQLLITCLFPDTPRAANCLISFNNRPVSDAVPAFDEVVLPLAQSLLAEGTGLGLLGGAVWNIRHRLDEAVGAFARTSFAPALLEGEILPLVRQTLEMLDQIPPLLQSIRDGTREFTPTPDETKEVIRKMYR
jgi:hypothetical protein